MGLSKEIKELMQTKKPIIHRMDMDKIFQVIKKKLTDDGYHHPNNCDAREQGCFKCSIFMVDSHEFLPSDIKEAIAFAAWINSLTRDYIK